MYTQKSHVAIGVQIFWLTMESIIGLHYHMFVRCQENPAM